MFRTAKFPATRAVLELVKTVVDEAGAKQISSPTLTTPRLWR